MATTTTLLLVLATTATLFFDLAAARCRVMMFNGGMIQGLHTAPVLGGVFEKNPDKADKVIIKYMTKSGAAVSGTTHHFFGTSGKWYDAEAILTAKHGAAEIPASDSNADGYYLAKDDDPTGTSVVADGRWTATVDTTKEISLSLPKAKASQVAWILGYDVATANKRPIYAYVNDGLLFRSGPLRYDAFNANMIVQATHPASKKFDLETKSLVVASAAQGRVFVGKGNYQNALVALKGYFAESTKQDGNTLTGLPNKAHENWIYIDVEGSDAHLTANANKADIDINTGAKIYVEAIAWMAAYDMKEGVLAHQVMYHVNDGFMNGELTPYDDKKVVGIVVFDGPEDTTISIYDLKATSAGTLDAVRIFYGLFPWDDAKAGLNAVSGAIDGGVGGSAFYVAGNAAIDMTAGTIAHSPAAVKSGTSHKASQVMWVAARQTTGTQATLAHRIMQMPKA